MKELQQIDKTSKEVQALKPIIKKSKLIGKLIPQKGHKCFEINVKTGEINEAKYSYVGFDLNGKVRRDIATKENCVYITALNKANAGKKMKKMIQDRIYSLITKK
jgi:cytochrome c2